MEDIADAYAGNDGRVGRECRDADGQENTGKGDELHDSEYCG